MANKALNKTAFWIVNLAAINWALHSFDWNVVEMALGSWPIVVSIVYWIVGLAGIWAIYAMLKK